MTNKIYRLADERDVGELVRYKDHGRVTAFKDGMSEGYGEGVLEKFEGRNYSRSYCIERAWWEEAFVEVTPADFSDEEIKSEYMNRPMLQPRIFSGAFGFKQRISGIVEELKHWEVFYKIHPSHRFLLNKISINAISRSIEVELPKEKTLADFSIDDLSTEMIKRGTKFFGYKDNLGEYHYWNIKNGKVKERTLADFGDEEFYQEISRRNKNDWARGTPHAWYEMGYESGKRDAEPKWVSVQERLPSEERFYWCASEKCEDYEDKGPVALQIPFHNGTWLTKRNITHWMYLPNPPAESRPEQKQEELLYFCKACKSKSVFYNFKTGVFRAAHSDDCQFKVDKEELKRTCAQCGAGFLPKGEWHITYPVYNKPGVHFCSHKCIEDYEWIDAEFPRDWMKECRLKKPGYEFREAVLIGKSKDTFIAEFTNPQFIDGGTCQVRRDSVENK